jgi:transposase
MLNILNPTPTQPPHLYLIIEPVDMRLGIEGLSNCIQTRLSTTPCAGGLYIFSNTRRNRVKLLLWDGTGVWLAQRRLHQGRFTWVEPTSSTTHHAIDMDTLNALIKGIAWPRLSASADAHQHWRVG